MNNLRLNTVPVLDWDGIWAGYVNYGENGKYFAQDLPRGIRLAIQPAEQSAPVMSREKRWEAGDIHYPSLIRDGDKYRLWYSAFADKNDPWVKDGHVPGKLPGVWCYAESTDGFNWERPNLGLVDFAGSKENNILFICEETGSHYGYMNVFRDSNGLDAERYKAIGIKPSFQVDGRPASKEEIFELRRRRDAAGDAGEIGANITTQVVITGGVSPDGIHWNHLDQPILETPWLLDTQNILSFDTDIEKYIIYLRSGRSRRRAVSRYEADDFRGPWGNHLMVLTAEPDDPPDWDIYAPCYCRHPHGGHLMFFNPYHRGSDLLDVHLATSHDGKIWYRPERRPIITNGDRYACLYPTPELTPIGDDLWGLLVLASRYPHNLSGNEEAQEYFWALWKRDRLVAWEAEDYAEFATTEFECTGQELQLNFKTISPGPYIVVEIVDGGLPNRGNTSLVPPLSGYSFADCDPLSGDHLDAVVRWRGLSDLSALRGKKIHLRFRMARSKLFAIAL